MNAKEDKRSLSVFLLSTGQFVKRHDANMLEYVFFYICSHFVRQTIVPYCQTVEA